MNTICLLLGLSFAMPSSSPGIAVDADQAYLLRVESHGYVRSTAVNPEHKLLRTLEVVVRVDQQFHTKTEVGPKTTTLSGKLKKNDDGSFQVDVSYDHSVDTGETVIVKDGVRHPIIHTWAADTTLSIDVGKPATISGLSSVSTETIDGTTQVYRSEERIIVHLKKFDRRK